jgi:hypothetical protein
MDQLKSLVMWLLELFPNVFPSSFRIKYIKKTGRIEWRYKNPERDTDDIFTLVLYNAKPSFFNLVVSPQLAKPVEGYKITTCWAGDERVIITFETISPVRCLKGTLAKGGLGHTLRGLTEISLYWPQRAEKRHMDAPPQE